MVPEDAPRIRVTKGGTLSVSDPALQLALRIVFPKWQDQIYASGKLLPEGEGLRAFNFMDNAPKNLEEKPNVAAGSRARGTLTVASDAAGGVTCRYRVELPQAVALEQTGLQGYLPVKTLGGGSLVADGKCQKVPLEVAAKATVSSGSARHVELRGADGRLLLGFDFAAPTLVCVCPRTESNRDFYTVRIVFAGRAELKAGSRLECAFTVRGADALKLEDGRPVPRVADADWTPFMPDTDIVAGSACDYSGLRGEVKPCGTYGRVVCRGPHFEFEGRPGVPVRFYGANVCFDACYMEEAKSDRLVELLTRAGYNSVRLHHFDRKLTEASPDATDPDPERMARLDHFLAKCYAAGLYVTTDFHIGRLVPRSVIEPGAAGRISQQEFKQLIFTNAPLRVNFKSYISKFMNHVNRETGRRYADEPGLFAIAFVNEGPAAWDPKGPHWSEQAIPLAKMEAEHAADLKRFLRDEVRSRVLVSNMSSGWSPPQYQLPRADVYDYVDSHFYYDHPQFPERKWCAPWKYANRNLLRDPQKRGFPGIALTRLFERPFVSTEFNFCAPSAYRMGATVIVGAAAALQDWSGVWRFEWTMNPADAVELDYREPFHATGFDTPGDPLQLVGEGLFASLFLRGDLAPLKERRVVYLDRKLLGTAKTNEVMNLKTTGLTWAGWRAQIGTTLERSTGGKVWNYPEAFENADRLVDGDVPAEGTVKVDHENGAMSVATDRSCAVFAEEGHHVAGALTVDMEKAPAAVWAIALDGRPLAESCRIQLVHATDCQSTDMRSLPGAPLIVFDHGRLPFLMRRGIAEVALARKQGDGAELKVYALSPGGNRLREVKTSVDSQGRVHVHCDTAADPQRATYLYELVR